MKKSFICTTTLLALGTLLPSAARAGHFGADLSIDDRTNEIIFQVNNFDLGFSVNSNQIQIGFGNQQTAAFPEGTGVDPLTYSFSGTWTNASSPSSFSQTVVFLEGEGAVVSDILTYAYVYNGTTAVVTGTFVSDVDGGTPLSLPEGQYITVGNEFYDFSSSGIIATADSTPEPGTWGLVLIGLSLAAVPLLRRKPDHSSGKRD